MKKTTGPNSCFVASILMIEVQTEVCEVQTCQSWRPRVACSSLLTNCHDSERHFNNGASNVTAFKLCLSNCAFKLYSSNCNSNNVTLELTKKYVVISSAIMFLGLSVAAAVTAMRNT